MLKRKDEDLDKECKKFIHSMLESKVMTQRSVPIMESALPLLIYKSKNEDKKSIDEWYAEIIMLFIGALISTILSTFSYIFLFILIILFIFRISLFMKTGR